MKRGLKLARGIVKPFSSPGGKEAWRGLILQRVPEHSTYVEPYAGSATIFFAKAERAKQEILSDVNPDIVATYVFLRDGSDNDFEWIRKQSWDWSPVTFKRLKSMSPRSRREKVYRFKYLNLFSVRGVGESLNTTENARRSTGKNFLRNLEKFRDRLTGVRIFQADALEVMKRFDGDDTFFYIDPPWKPVGTGDEWHNFDADAFKSAIHKLRGKAVVSYQGAIDLPDPWKKVTIASALGGVGASSEQHILINFDPPIAKTYYADPTGRHGHDMSRTAGSTGVTTWDDGEQGFKAGEPSGPHTHMFVINGMVVQTECDGSHAHNIGNEAAETTDEDGEHTHRIPTASGPIETSAEGSAHTHELDVDSQVAWGGGAHQHTVEVEGQTITSLTAGEFWSLFVAPNQARETEEAEPDSEIDKLTTQMGLRRVKAKKQEVEISKPFPNEHRARQADPSGFEKFRRGKPEGFPAGVEVIYGITSDGTSQVQSVAFDADKWTADDAKAWLEEHDLKSDTFEAASASEKLYPKKRAPVPALVHLQHDGEEHFIAVRMKHDDRAIGWRLATQRETIGVDQVETLAKSATPHGDRFSRSIVGTRVLALKGAPSTRKAIAIDKLVAEYGLQSANVREYFLSKGKSFSGVLRFETLFDSAGRSTWVGMLSKTALPFVLTEEAVRARVMPPDGVSALPRSIEKMVPPELRFWKFRGDEARAARDALVEKGVVTEVGIVNGELRAILTKRFVAPYPTFADAAIKAARPTSPVLRATKLIAWESGSKPLLIGPNVATEIGPDDLVAKLRKSKRDYLIGWPDSAYVRSCFAELGRPFVLKRVPGDLVFVSSRAVSAFDEVEFVEHFDLATEIAKVVSRDDPAAVLKRIAKIYDSVMSREIPIYLTKQAEGDREEMFVYGIVLEPDTVDAQQDTYTSDEIRKAAHGFMEFHRNRGDQHKTMVNDKVVILESHIERAPDFVLVDSTGRERKVKQGSWLMGYGIRDAELWSMVKAGERTGFSIGGSAVRTPRAA